MNYRSYADLSLLVHRSLHRIPRDVCAVVGVPRSGLMVASLVALALNLPLGDVEGFVAGRLLSSGKTRRRAAFDVLPERMSRILIVEDSVDTGASLGAAVESIRAARPDVKIVTLAAYTTPATSRTPDIALEILPHPRVFEWNMFHHVQMENSCLDIDGVVCVDPTEDENDDGPLYAAFLAAAAPMHLPTKKVHTLVTNRLERYRAQTEEWLARNGVAYGTLVMCPARSKEERLRLGRHGEFKGEVYRRSPTSLFVESDPSQATIIARLSGKPVFCVEDGGLVLPDRLSSRAFEQAARNLPKAASGRILAAAFQGKQWLRTRIGVARYEGLKRALRGK